MLVTMLLAALAIDGLFSITGLIPNQRPTRADIFSSVKVDYRLFANLIGTAVFVTLFALTVRRGATDPVCGMRVDRHAAVKVHAGDRTEFFCSQQCAEGYLAIAAARPTLPPGTDAHGARLGND